MFMNKFFFPGTSSEDQRASALSDLLLEQAAERNNGLGGDGGTSEAEQNALAPVRPGLRYRLRLSLDKTCRRVGVKLTTRLRFPVTTSRVS